LVLLLVSGSTAKRRPNEEAVAKRRARFALEIRAYRVREIRDEQGMTQKELAERMAITQPTIFALESGDFDRLGLATFSFGAPRTRGGPPSVGTTPEGCAVVPWASSGVLGEESSEGSRVPVPDGGGDAGDCSVGGLKEVAGAMDARRLQVLERTLAGLGGEAPQQRPSADMECV
jgi:DNA-binding XRE family transcriptional regulator